jgi:chromosome segregation ATPase
LDLYFFSVRNQSVNLAQCKCSSDNQRYTELVADIGQLQNKVDVINRTHIADINDVTTARERQQTTIDDMSVSLNATHAERLGMLVTMQTHMTQLQTDAQKQQDKYNDDMVKQDQLKADIQKLKDQHTNAIQSQTSVIQQLENKIQSLEDKSHNQTNIIQHLKSRNRQHDLDLQNLTAIVHQYRDDDIKRLAQQSNKGDNMTVTGKSIYTHTQTYGHTQAHTDTFMHTLTGKHTHSHW